MSDLQTRLDSVRKRLTSEEFLKGRGLGNEVPFYAFDYPAAEEPRVCAYVRWLMDDVSKKTDLRVAEINVFSLAIETLKRRGLLEKALSMEQVKGPHGLMNALRGPLEPGKLARACLENVNLDELDMILLTGVGQAYPLVRAHSLLNNLQPLTGNTPVVMFFPGNFSGLSLRLFGDLQETPYYRAFRLVD